MGFYRCIKAHPSKCVDAIFSQLFQNNVKLYGERWKMLNNKYHCKRHYVWNSSIFSSAELQVSFSFCLLSTICPSICKLFTFSSSTPVPIGQFQPNLPQFKACLGEGLHSFPRGDNSENVKVKIHWHHLKI